MTDALIDERSGRRRSVWSAAVVYLVFAVPTSMLGVIWPDVRDRFAQSLGALGLVTLSYGVGRLSVAMSGRSLVERLGIARAFVVSLIGLAVACACLAIAVSWVMFLLAAGALGVACGTLDSIGSTFITRRANVGDAGLLHGFYGLGATMGPLVVAVTSDWRLAVGVSVVAASVAVVTTSLSGQSFVSAPVVVQLRSDGPASTSRVAVAASVLVLGAFVAIEVTVGQWSYTYLTDVRGVSDTVAAVGVAGFWGASTVGRLVMSLRAVSRLADRVGLVGLAIGAALMFGGIAVAPAAMSTGFLALAGLMLSPIVPTLFATTAMRVGPGLAARASGWQLAATNIGAISVPALIGVLVDSVGPRIVPWAAVIVVVAVGMPLLVLVRRLPDRSVIAQSI